MTAEPRNIKNAVSIRPCGAESPETAHNPGTPRPQTSDRGSPHTAGHRSREHVREATDDGDANGPGSGSDRRSLQHLRSRIDSGWDSRRPRAGRAPGRRGDVAWTPFSGLVWTTFAPWYRQPQSRAAVKTAERQSSDALRQQGIRQKRIHQATRTPPTAPKNLAASPHRRQLVRTSDHRALAYRPRPTGRRAHQQNRIRALHDRPARIRTRGSDRAEVREYGPVGGPAVGDFRLLWCVRGLVWFSDRKSVV